MDPLVSNVGDKKQIKSAAVKEKLLRDTQLNDMRAVLSLPQGKRLLARILAETRVHSSVWHPSAMIHKLAGAQEIGQFLMKEIVAADHVAAAEMFVEAYKTALEGA